MNARLLASLTVFNAVMLALSFAFWLAQPAATAIAQSTLPVLRGRGLEIVDDAGRVRASISILPADPNVKMPDGSVGTTETVLLRLINSKGRPNVKIAAHERGAGALVAGDTDPTWVQILAEDGYTSVRLTNKDGRVQTLKP
jgi:hypothetical protein